MSLLDIINIPEKIARRVYHYWRRQKLRRNIIPIDATCPNKSGVLFIGYAEGALGLGQAFRADLDAAATADMLFSIYPFRINIETRLLPPYMPERYDRNHIHDINVIEIMVDQLPFLYDSLNPELLKNSYNILRTYWELERVPEAWRPLLAPFQEIWAPNSFIADSFKNIFNKQIRIIPPAITIENLIKHDKTYFNLENDRFYFMFSFDYYSSAYRKNPLGVLQAFRLAFPLGDENVGLVIKSNGNPDLCPEFVQALQKAIIEDPRIVVIDNHLSRKEMLGLIQTIDVYMSLHRAEGFGFGMAEALSLGRTVIATGYSGNRDFLTEETGFPVPFIKIPIEPHEYPYSTGQYWAEPDIQAAADIMHRVALDPTAAHNRAQKGQRLIHEQYSTMTLGNCMKAHVAEIAHKLATRKGLEQSL